MDANLEDESFSFPYDHEDLFTALGKKDVTENENSDSVTRRAPATVSLRQHRLRRALASADEGCSNPNNLSVTLNRPKSWCVRQRWRWALHQIRNLEDPWRCFHLEQLPGERAVRHRYSALKKTWVQDDVCVKIENLSFNHGAMRECFRLKKLSNWVHVSDWSRAGNYVAKRYIESVPRAVYFDDVRLQMEAKLWAEAYNRSNPAKKIDIVQMSVIEFIDRPGQPLYHLEHFIEGDYRKYNSNSGFVDETLRFTPQAFSHFTFERSGHQLIVIDIQGVGDLYTDPQIHTACGTDYGDGNLGTRGMALFFHSHRCNPICSSLGLGRFDLTSVEDNQCQRPPSDVAGTVVRAGVLPIGSPELSADFFFSPCSPCFPSSDSGVGNMDDEDGMDDEEAEDECEEVDEVLSESFSQLRHVRRPRHRYESSCSELDHEEEQLAFHLAQRALHQGSSQASRVLAGVHHELAKLHQGGRFGEPLDWEAILFHERRGAELGCVEAMLNLGLFMQDRPSDLLEKCPVKPGPQDHADGFGFLQRAAELGDRAAMIFVAGAFQAGAPLANVAADWRLSVDWFGRAVASSGCADIEGSYDAAADHPIYELLASAAEMLLQGGHGLAPDCRRAAELLEQAAEAATAAMKGRLACRLYERMEEALAGVEDEE